MIFNFVIGVVIWFIVFFLLTKTDSKYLVTANQCNNAVGVIHVLSTVVPCILYFLFIQPLWDYTIPMSRWVISVLTLAVSFYVFAIITLLFIGRKTDWFGIFHHAVIVAFAFYFLSIPETPVYFYFLAFFLIPGAFYSSYLVYKESEDSKKEVSYKLFKWNAHSWLIVRIILFAIYALYLIYCEWTKLNPNTVDYRTGTILLFVMVAFFNIYYYVFIKRKLHEMRAVNA